MDLTIRDGDPAELERLGRLLVDVYAGLEDFPTPEERPDYYAMLLDVATFASRPGARVLVAISGSGELLGGVVYFGDMAQYGTGGTATSVTDASGIRLLGVAPAARGLGVGKALTLACVEIADSAGHAEVVLHTTKAMPVAWAMYERLGFVRSPGLDFERAGLAVYGFRRMLRGA